MREKCREGKTGSDWEEERGNFFKERELDAREVERRRLKDDMWWGELIKKDREKKRNKRE